MFSFNGCIWKKQKYYLLLVWATQSMFHIVANRNSAPRAVSSRPARGWWDVRGEARPPGVRRWPRVPPPPTTSFNHCRRHGTLAVACAPRAGMPGVESLLPCWTKVGNYEFYFHVILFTWNLHYTRCECTLYLFVVRGPVAERERREARFALCCSLTWEELGWWRDAELIFIHSDAKFHHHSIRSLGPTAINNSADMFLIRRAATCAALWILEEKKMVL